jgi:DNA adenine methylase
MDARFNRRDLIKRIEKIASYAPRINLYNIDAAKFLTERLPKIPKNSLVYLDPLIT